MGYLSIDNLYRVPEIFECYALEKIHGTSAHVAWDDGIRFFAGGVSHEQFVTLFDQDLGGRLAQSFPNVKAVVYGEAFGGKCQGMSAVYGKELRFLAFDVKVNDAWLDVPSAAAVVKELGLGFVPYERGPLTLDWLNEQRDRPSLVAVVEDAIREGVVVRPIREATRNNGERVIVKHKRPEFRETKTEREVDPARLKVLSDASEIADEWVTPMRLQHVLQKTPYEKEADTGRVIRAMIEDVRKESGGEVVWSKEVERAIGRATAAILHRS